MFSLFNAQKEYPKIKKPYTEIKLHMDLNKWLEQNRAEITECIEGSLIDNYIAYCKKGIAFIFETYANPWNSIYTIYYFRFANIKSDEYRQIEKNFYRLED